MSDENSWIDDVIKQHKKQLDQLKKSKNCSEDKNTYSTIFQTINKNPSISNSPIKYESKTISTSTNLPLSIQTQSTEDKLRDKLQAKKLKIKNLKLDIQKLKEENDELKQKNNELENKLDSDMNVYQNNNQESLNSMLDELHKKINNLEIENQKKDKKIFQLETLKNQEIELMNQKIKDFEIIIDENSNNFITERSNLTKQIEDYQQKIMESDKYVEVVNFFIQKIDNIFNIESRAIYDIKELQNKFVEIENFILKKVTSKDNQNISKNSEINNIEDKFLNENSITNNENNQNLRVPHFQNKFLEEGFASNTNNNSNQSLQEDLLNDKETDYKTLEERVFKLENELRKKKNTVKRNNSGTKNFQTKLTNTNPKTIRSKSSTKIPMVRNETKKIKKIKKNKKGINHLQKDNDNSKCDSNQMSTISNINHNTYSTYTVKKKKQPSTKIKKQK